MYKHKVHYPAKIIVAPWLLGGDATLYAHFLQFSAHGAIRNLLRTFVEHASQLLNTFPPVCFYKPLQRKPVTSIQKCNSATITTE